MLVNASRNAVVLGSRFNADLDEVEAFLAKLSQQSGLQDARAVRLNPKECSLRLSQGSKRVHQAKPSTLTM
jgi:hypothetical protein